MPRPGMLDRPSGQRGQRSYSCEQQQELDERLGPERQYRLVEHSERKGDYVPAVTGDHQEQ